MTRVTSFKEMIQYHITTCYYEVDWINLWHPYVYHLIYYGKSLSTYLYTRVQPPGEIFPLSMPRAVSKWNQNAKHVWIAETSCFIAFKKGSGLVVRGRTLINLLQSNNSQLWLTFLYWKPLGIVTATPFQTLKHACRSLIGHIISRMRMHAACMN